VCFHVSTSASVRILGVGRSWKAARFSGDTYVSGGTDMDAIVPSGVPSGAEQDDPAHCLVSHRHQIRCGVVAREWSPRHAEPSGTDDPTITCNGGRLHIPPGSRTSRARGFEVETQRNGTPTRHHRALGLSSSGPGRVEESDTLCLRGFRSPAGIDLIWHQVWHRGTTPSSDRPDIQAIIGIQYSTCSSVFGGAI
jgi:hypothetical protein